ncbi:MAG TPA: hypothetical protein PKC60_02115 [Hydrogenophaga sp.]|uniref:alginate O-acetyltransferase AlgX-related protein n=1 Tax=Hydrogenophaga sp. TaxID=1904254 RepID=UPI002C22302A|nr:hypothetical protein [Hydrogenophaga sp.]HMN92001.1 hypothetical protein [Hydrogenophaga sp.]HMP08803.1 hypothetical protein [Hydrogenophaga sp.]
MARLILNPVNYLNPTLTKDDHLVHKIEGGTGGHDDWGFRNFERPITADIVAIGDSMTYGMAARAEESYPLVLGRLSGQNVYNMGLGGYGPLQYLHLLRTKALELKPTTVIVGFYFGNDVMDAFNTAHGLEYWSRFSTRQFDSAPTQRVRSDASTDGKLFGTLRDWLSRNSVLYRAFTSLPLFDVFRENQFKRLASNTIEATFGGRRMLFSYQEPTVYLDLTDERAKEGMRITEAAFREIAETGRQKGIQILVVMFPLKESVYEEYLKQSVDAPGVDRLLISIKHEMQIKQRLLTLFNQEGIDHLDLLPALRQANQLRDVFPLSDTHPNANGYVAIAASVNRALKSHSSR